MTANQAVAMLMRVTTAVPIVVLLRAVLVPVGVVAVAVLGVAIVRAAAPQVHDATTTA